MNPIDADGVGKCLIVLGRVARLLIWDGIDYRSYSPYTSIESSISFFWENTFLMDIGICQHISLFSCILFSR